jgi:hypothetical protein
MASMYVARLKNARRIGHKLKHYLKAGYLIFDEQNSRVTSVHFKGFAGNVGLSVGHTVYMDADTNLANGMELTITEFNALFKDWTIVHPRHFVKL